MDRLRRRIQVLLALGLVATGVAGAIWLVGTRPAPPRSADGRHIPHVVVDAVTATTFDAPIIAYGTVRPKNQVKVIPQVSGMLVDMHPDLAVGKIIPKGEVLYQIDRRTYESQVLQVKADIKMLEVQLRQHEVRRANLTRRLESANEQLRLAEADVTRERELVDRGASQESAVDRAREKFLHAQDLVLQYESELALIPHQVEETNARLEAGKVQLADAERNLSNTAISSPFDARVDLVSARTSQVVHANFAIASLTDVSALELPAVMDPDSLQWADRRAYARAVGGDLGEPPAVTVTWTLHNRRYSWTGHVSRLERHDEATRTAHLVIDVPQSLDEIRSSEAFGKPALSIGMFCSAEIPAEPLHDALVLPRSAIHEDNVVYVFEPDSPDATTGRLALRTVPILRNVNDHVVVDFAGRADEERLPTWLTSADCTLQPGEQVVLSPLPRPVEGMELRLRDVNELGASLASRLAAQLPQPVASALTINTPLATLPNLMMQPGASTGER